jgi:F0F1-type ATP synthase membrane subunit b/b'
MSKDPVIENAVRSFDAALTTARQQLDRILAVPAIAKGHEAKAKALRETVEDLERRAAEAQKRAADAQQSVMEANAQARKIIADARAKSARIVQDANAEAAAQEEALAKKLAAVHSIVQAKH